MLTIECMERAKIVEERWLWGWGLHCGPNKMAAILQTPFSNAFSCKKYLYFDLDFAEFCSPGPVNNNAALIQVMAWCLSWWHQAITWTNVELSLVMFFGIHLRILSQLVPWDLTDERSTLVHVMAWCRQAPSHYLNRCWPRSMSP